MVESTRTYDIAWLPGDGIGPDVTRQALNVLEAVGDEAGFDLQVREHPVGGAALDAAGNPLPDATREACQQADAVLLGAVGGPKWDDQPAETRPEAGLLALRKLLGVYANLRPVTVSNALINSSPLKHDLVQNTDLLVVRELTGGIYFSEPSERKNGTAVSTMRYSKEEVERIARVAFERAGRRKGRVASVDKANVLEVSALWRETVREVHAREYPEIELQHLYVDNAAMQVVLRPADFDVILTGNLFGDILSDLGAALPGSLGVLPSASVGSKVGVFEPVHGSAPDLVGSDQANPLAAILSGAMLLDELGEGAAARAVRNGVEVVLSQGYRTADLHQAIYTLVGTDEMGDRIAEASAEHMNRTRRRDDIQQERN